MRLTHSIISLLFLLSPLALHALDGSAVVSGGGTVSFTGASSTNWVKSASGDPALILVYDNPDEESPSFTFDGLTQARILAVGGGGGGGGLYRNGGQSPYGGGAGGGAGGFVEVTNMYPAATFTVSVGAGGVGGKNTTSTSAECTGDNGDPTTVTMNGDVMLTALGGGGGGGQSPGLEPERGVVASGGGGSQKRNPSKTTEGIPQDGGLGTDGQGHDGGAGDAAIFGGGGGGAGKPGAPASSGNPVGGDGRPSDIAVDFGTAEEDIPWYAGGGGGADSARTPTGATEGIAGGRGGGGQGGCRRSPGLGGEAKAGEPGTGGGGGGAAANSTGVVAGTGGSGVVIVRIEASGNGEVAKPSDSAITYDGASHPIIKPSPFYIVDGENSAKDVGIYTASVKPIEGFTWDDETADPITVRLVICAEDSLSGEELVTGAPVKFFGASSVTRVKDEAGNENLLLEFRQTGTYVLPGASSVRILAVGGGGGGGGLYRNGGQSPYGGGAGGGAGGFVEVTNLYGEATYIVNVGSGGAAGKNTTSTTASCAGENGDPTTIMTNGVAMIKALGGGGGGGQSPGLESERGVVASGGGGSQKRNPDKTTEGLPQDGGLGTEGQGHDGGAGDAAIFGGGGGGAGQPGAAASTGNPVGGDGRPSDIAVDAGTAEDQIPWYAGGGGGADSARTPTGATEGIAGGKGGGGQGGCRRSPAEGGKAKAGEPGTGGGGGGAAANSAGTVAGAGGSGIVYIRISSAMKGEFKKPAPYVEYTYDGEGHVAIQPFAFYDISDENVRTNAGTYHATATLKPGVSSWPDGTTGPVTTEMKILKRSATISNLHIANWEVFTEEEKKPNPTCTISPGWVEVIYMYAPRGEDAAGTVTEWSADKPSDAGSYWVRATAPDDGNYDCEPAYFAFEVTKIQVTITGYRIRDWEVGAPATKPHCTVAPARLQDEIKFQWKAKVEGEEWKDWTDGPPTALGTYLLRAVPPDFDDYEYTPESDPPFEFHIVKGLGGSFSDYVEIEIDGYEGETLVNWPYRVELSETHPVGFAYTNAPFYGEHMAFTDASGENKLPYEVKSWTTNGTSVIYVKIPTIGKEKQKIRLYWHERPGASIPQYDPDEVWTGPPPRDPEEVKKLDPPQPGMSFPSPVCQDGRYVNYWLQKALINPDFWDASNPPENPLKRNAVLAYGQTLRVLENLVTRTAVTNVVTMSSSTEIPTTEGGNFRISYFQGDDIDHEYTPLRASVEYSVTASIKVDDLKGDAKTLTLSGRVMLANDDTARSGGVDPAHAVTDQSWWQVREVVTNETTGATMTNDVFWTHGGDMNHGTYRDLSEITHMMPGTEHKLNYMVGSQTQTLWRLSDVIIGNTFRDGTGVYGAGLFNNQCVLPWSTTGLGISSYTNYYTMRGKVLESSNLILRNKKDAAIYSPCYTNGIGTIYFDAVNNTSDDAGLACSEIVVEMVTKSSFGGIDPTDENVSMENPRTVEEEMGKIGTNNWKKCEMLPFERFGEGANLNPVGKVKVFALNVTTGKTADYFYRFCVKVNCREACRFRIRRLSQSEIAGRTADNGSLILVDNIIVSYPSAKAVLEPDGIFETKDSTKLVVGQENAFVPPFPSVKDAQIFGRGVPACTASAVTNVNPAGMIARGTLHYRWRYLDQAFDPPDGSWRTKEMKPGSGFVTGEPLELPRTEGDVEFWYESDVNVPYYKYFDYTGLEVGLDGSGYSEQVSVTTNGYDRPWYVRLRPGRSDLEGFRIIAKTAADAAPQAVEMTLAGNGMWRGYWQTPDAVDGGDGKGLFVRFEAYNRQKPGSSGFATNTTFYTLANDLRELMVPASLEKQTADPSNKWSRVACDAQTGYILFQLSEENLAATVVHADYQDFNKWNDANSDDKVSAAGTPPFTGTSFDEKKGSSSRTREWKETFDWWRASQATSTNWTETFKVTVAEMGEGGAFEVFKPFSKTNSPNGFQVGPGQWITSAYRDYNSGAALQMEGCGKGYIQFVNAAVTPRGIESITFKPRIAQAIEFGDFSYYELGAALDNYTFYCRVAYDVLERMSFTGDASLSLVAFYRAGKGCYEFRVEQDTAVIKSGVVTGPSNVHRLSLYKWTYNSAKGKMLPVRLGSSTIDKSGMLTTKADESKGEVGNYALMFISAKNTATATEICAGISTGVAAVGSTSGQSCRWVAYIDSDAGARFGPRFKNGSYGFVSANCPARFRNLKYSSAAQGAPTTTKDTWYFGESDATFTQPSSATSCKGDLDKDLWVVQPHRAQRIDSGDAVTFGFEPVPVSNTVSVYTAPAGSTAFDMSKPLYSMTIDNFGAVDPVTLPLYSLKDCSVMIAPGGLFDDARVDVVVDDVEIRQWRGESFDDTEGRLYFRDFDRGSPTNFVFTQAWIWSNATEKVQSVELSAKRSLPTVATSIRTPLFDGMDGRGLGLGMFGFSYTNAQENARLLLQVCTNGVDITTLRTVSKEPDEFWETVETYDFSKLPLSTNRVSGTLLHYFGWHAKKGTMRLVVDPKLVTAVADEEDPAKFGSVTITEAVCRDEPDLDRFAWWGWNLQTTGLAGRLGLWDGDRDKKIATGQAFGLNNSVEDDLAEDPKLYPAHLPFLQTPTFATNTVGEVSFKARKYHPEDEDCRVTLYGAVDGTKALDDWNGWTPLKYWTITSSLYTNCTYKASQGQTYCAFRFVVTGVPGVTTGRMRPIDPPPPETDPVKRVLIDEVTVMETISARVAFRNVAAFRTWLDNDRAIIDILSEKEQPLVNESWGVQGEIYAAQLANEVDLSSAKVRLWWYDGLSPWGFDRWKDLPEARSAWLRPAGDQANVWRSSYLTCPDAVVPLSPGPMTVQYMLEVVWKAKDSESGVETEVTNRMALADWPKPEWYRGVDYNAQFGGDADASRFAGYTILDTVAPHWSWINEANILGTYDAEARNSDADLQYVEVAAPAEADLSGWTVRMVEGDGVSTVYTNTIATFGGNLEGLKKDLLGQASGMVFRVVGSPKTFNGGRLSSSRGEIDGVWSFECPTPTFDGVTGEVNWSNPFGIQLVRPSGIIEHEIVLMGYNYYGEHSRYPEDYEPTNTVNYLNARMPGSRFFYAGADDTFTAGGSFATSRSLSVCDSKGETSNCWDRAMILTPGRINTYADGTPQVIPADHPTPIGDTILVRCNLSGDGKLVQTVGEAVESPADQIIVIKKGSATGTNITYTAAPWYELGTVTMNGTPFAERIPLGDNRWAVNVGKGASNGFTVVASAAISSRLRELGVDENNRYREAIMKWLEGGEDLHGNTWPESDGEVYLADFRDLAFNLVTNLDLTTMYWLDICPTITNQHLVGGMWKAPVETSVEAPRRKLRSSGVSWPDDQAVTNAIRNVIYLAVTNSNPPNVAANAGTPLEWHETYAPYVIRGMQPGYTSWEYATNGVSTIWTNGSFKIAGILMNGLTDRESSLNWVPLRWFVFTEDSFYKPGNAEGKDPFTAVIEVENPKEKGSVGYDVWGAWVEKNCGGVWPNILYHWELNERQRMYDIEILKADSTFH